VAGKYDPLEDGASLIAKNGVYGAIVDIKGQSINAVLLRDQLEIDTEEEEGEGEGEDEGEDEDEGEEEGQEEDEAVEVRSKVIKKKKQREWNVINEKLMGDEDSVYAVASVDLNWKDHEVCFNYDQQYKLPKRLHLTTVTIYRPNVVHILQPGSCYEVFENDIIVMAYNGKMSDPSQLDSVAAVLEEAKVTELGDLLNKTVPLQYAVAFKVENRPYKGT